jgi:hypothetical protein
MVGAVMGCAAALIGATWLARLDGEGDAARERRALALIGAGTAAVALVLVAVMLWG